MKTSVLAVMMALLIAAAAPRASALPQSATEQVRFFATCTGRLSALMEHQWMFDGPESERTKQQRAGFVALLDAVVPDAIASGLPGKTVLSWRINAKMAQATLLQAATFSDDPRRAERSRMAAEAFVAECNSMLLG